MAEEYPRCPETLDVILSTIFQDVGLGPDDYDVTQVAGISVLGHYVDQRQEASQNLGPLLQAYSVDLGEWDGKIHAVPRGGASAVTIVEDDLGARIWSGPDDADGPLEGVTQVRRIQELELPHSVDFVFQDPDRDYEQGNQGAIRQTKTHLDEVLTFNTNLVMDVNQARQTAQKLLYTIWLERMQFQFSLGYNYLEYVPTDVVTLPHEGSSFRIRLVGADVAVPGPIAFEAALDDSAVLTQTVDGAPGRPPDTTTIISRADFFIWSGNAIKDGDADSIGYYVAAAQRPEDLGIYTGVLVQHSFDGGTEYEISTHLLRSISHGETFDPNLDADLDLPPGSSTPVPIPAGTTTGYWDTTSTLYVTMNYGTLSGSTDLAVLNGANRILVDNEIIAFVNVTQLGTDSYALSRLLRGQRGTDAFWGSHAFGERVIVLDDADAYTHITLDDGLYNKTIQVKALTGSETLADVTAISHLVTGAEAKPYSPAHIKGTRDASQNLTIEWIRRTRKGGSMSDGAGVPVSETTEAYEVDILQTAGGTVLHTFQNITTPTLIYSAAAQVTDFGSTQSTVNVAVYQMGEFGRGYAGTAAV